MENDTSINAFILCGGKSSRMGTDKGFVHFKNRSFTDWCLEAVSQITREIHLVTGEKKYAQFGYPLLEDIYKEKGPVGGIYTALENSATHWNLILSCDLPGITGSLLTNLVTRKPENVSVAFLSNEKNDYPLVGMYHKDCKKVFSEAIQENELKLMKIIKKMDYARIEVQASENNNLNNINTPQELDNLNKRTL